MTTHGSVLVLVPLHRKKEKKKIRFVLMIPICNTFGSPSLLVTILDSVSQQRAINNSSMFSNRSGMQFISFVHTKMNDMTVLKIVQ